MKNIKVFGLNLDPDERDESVVSKFSNADSNIKDPYEIVSEKLKDSNDVKYIQLGKVQVEPWLVPAPKKEDLFMVDVDNLVAFIDADGCREYALKVKEFIEEKVFPDTPLMIGVDHSGTGGCIEALAEKYGKANLSVVMLDSHFDGIIPTQRLKLIQHDIEYNPQTKFSKEDPYLYNRVDSFNADSFLYFLLKEKKIVPKNLFVLGVSDYPPNAAKDARDSRIREYYEFYRKFEEDGVTILPKNKLKANFDMALKKVLEKIKTPYVYVSVDIDIGSRQALTGARFLDYLGLEESEIYKILDGLNKYAKEKKIEIVGADVMEIDQLKAGKKFGKNYDRTYDITLEVIKRIFK
ncbi:MAG: formimidoylglutamase [Candidatus Methanofastidiosum methylothiophilum]|uniref:Formimidoylglutamase n=1 Tax=Candidatus Methanofastidiosum methylothiophilum TaxID=1705564 RepID=A0A150IIF1_9EURY|nr:MAG: formimidoylglutamase [Candidatus Methanofastidiosum methylthiophilus]KYC47227.1 MAG: formimidoylglutamase [Candidatus Methanofastidiosum methylthiophilus]KYC49161.1 MAG: formimidoylglutamase [Candidatus Methanofastidiosum methylthiophilus]